MRSLRPSTLLLPAVALAAGTALAEPPGQPSAGPAAGKDLRAQLEEARAKAKEARVQGRDARKDANEAREEAFEALKDLHGPTADRLRKIIETRVDRRSEHRVQLFREWGRFLDRPEVVRELRQHAERTARLRRTRFVAETERKGPDQEKLLARIDRLIQKENARHARVMQRFAAVAETAPVASGAKP